jgi:Cysteine rich repeat
MIRRTLLVTLVLASCCGAPAFAQDRQFPLPLPFPNFEGTPEEQKACRPDVARLCPETVQEQNPDQQRILACLQRHRAGLKPACRTVLDNHGV